MSKHRLGFHGKTVDRREQLFAMTGVVVFPVEAARTSTLTFPPPCHGGAAAYATRLELLPDATGSILSTIATLR